MQEIEIGADTKQTGTKEVEESAGADLAGKYMSFKLAQEVYGIGILNVREIIGLMPITKVPRTEAFIRGVINLRGKVIPVLDLRLKFNMERAEQTDQSVIIVVQTNYKERNFTMGILVDEVLEVLSIDAKEIEPTPSFGTGAFNADFILGVGKKENRVIFLLDIGRILTNEEAVGPARASMAPETFMYTQTATQSACMR